METKENQHYLPQMYLKEWNNPNVFWLYRNKIQQRNVKTIACEKRFYEFRPFSQKEVDFVRWIYVDNINIKEIREFAEEWLRDCITISNFNKLHCFLCDEMKKIVKVHGDNKKIKVKETLKKATQDRVYLNANFIEDKYSKIESEFEHKVLSKLRNGDESILKNADLRWLLNRYVWSQYLRTKNVKEAILPTLQNGFIKYDLFSGFGELDLEVVYMLLIPMFAYNACYVNFNKPAYLLVNNTDLAFIQEINPL